MKESIKILVILISICQIPNLLAIKCYQCESTMNGDCGDPFPDKGKAFLVDCDQFASQHRNYTFCTKIVKSDKGAKFVKRRCDFLENPNSGKKFHMTQCLKQSGSESMNCGCITDKCNNGNVISAGRKLIIFLVFFVRVFAFLFWFGILRGFVV